MQTKKNTLFCPVRANLLGGWTDQEMWPEMAAVSNVAIGWPGTYRGQYPLMMDRRGVLRSKVKGHGSGLGISSILLALREIHEKPGMLKGDLTSVILKVLEEERAISQGGWQDQVGGVVPGLKLTVTSDHRKFHIRSKPFHPALERMVIFDTGRRRPSAHIGDRIRDLIEARDPAFMRHMRWIAFEAMRTFDDERPEEMILSVLESWRKFVGFVSQMEIPIKLPRFSSRIVHGSYLTGAGGGGFGITWVTNPGYRDEVVSKYKEAGIWSVVPVVINSGPLVVYR
jgi:galactokinase/mevalonate kinase-like predicted kinase